MKYAFIALSLLLSLLVGMTIAFSAEEEDAEAISNWSHKTPIILEQAPDKGLTEFVMTQGVSDLAKKDLSDLRLVEKESGRNVPIVMRWPRHYRKDNIVTPFYAKLYNRTYKPHRSSTVVADFGKENLKNNIKIKTPGTNFRRKVLIEGSDNGKKWGRVRAGAFLFTINASWLPKGQYVKDTITIQSNNQRYLRITVFNGEDDPSKIDIRKISFTHVRRPEPAEGPNEIRPTGTQTEQLEKEKATLMTYDLGNKNLPIHKIELDIEEENFFRRVTVQGRDRETYIKVINTENGKIKKETKQPWKSIANSVIYRFTAGEKPDEKLDIDLRNASYRYLKIRIENRDDPPLTFVGALAEWNSRLISFQAEKQRSYALYFGNPKAKMLSHDFSHYSERLREEGVTVARLGDVVPNEDYLSEKSAEKPWHERYSYALWIALIAAVAVMAFLIFRLAANPPKED